MTPAGMKVRLAMKVAVSVGAARRFLVGDPGVQRIDVLAGRLIDELAGAEHQAEKGEVVLDRSALEALGDRVEIREMRVEEDGWREFGVVDRLTVPVEATPASVAGQPAAGSPREGVAAARHLRAASRRAWGVPGRAASSVPGLSSASAASTTTRTRMPSRSSTASSARCSGFSTSYGGNLLHLTLGDKGAYLYAVFGSPRGHEDDAARAAAAALELRALQATTAARNIQIGITYGRLRSGTYGHKDRQTFTCIGGAVNLAARLMAKAPPGRIYVAEDVRRAAGDVFTWQQLPPSWLEGQGRARLGVRPDRIETTRFPRPCGYEFPLFGREAELDVLEAKLDEALASRGQIVGISAEAGMGKSRLATEFARKARDGAPSSRSGSASRTAPIRATSPGARYGPRCSVSTPPSRGGAGAALEAELAAIDPGSRPRAPLLASLLDLPIPDNELTAQFDAKLRKTSLEGLLVECLRARAPRRRACSCSRIATGSIRSRAICSRCWAARWRASRAHRACLSSERERRWQARSWEPPAFRRDRAPGARRRGRGAAHPSTLSRTAPEGTERPRRARGARHRQGAGQSLLHRGTAQLHPEPGCRSAERGPLRNLQLPESLHSLILSRIDTLGEAPRRTLKVASVPGRVFRAPMLPGVYPELGGVDRGERAPAYACGGRFRQPGPGGRADLSLQAGRHPGGRVRKPAVRVPFDAPRALRRFIETSESDAIERNLDLLAHHYWHSENAARNANTWNAPVMRPRPHTQIRRRSTTSSACAPGGAG